MSNPLNGWAQRAATLPAALVDATPEAVRTGAEVLESAVRVNLTAASGGDLRLSRVRSGKGAKLDTDVRVEGAGRSARGVVVPTGPVMLIERPTRGHRQPFVYTYNRRIQRRGLKRIRIPGVGVFSRVQHPGTRGKQPVARAFAAAGSRAGVAGVAVFTQAARRHMGGSA